MKLAPGFKEWEVVLTHLPSKKRFICTAYARNDNDAEQCAFNTPPVMKKFGEKIKPDEWEAEITEIVED